MCLRGTDRVKSRFSFLISIILVGFGLVMIYRSLTGKSADVNMDTALGIVLVIYGVSRYFLYSRFGRPRH